MGSYEWPCPKCGTAQKVRAPNGSEVAPKLCAACEEAEREAHQADIKRTRKETGRA